MTNLKKLMMTAAMMGIIMAGLTSANAGILLTDSASNNAQTTTEAKEDKGIVITGFIGIVITGLTGIVIHD
jgi:aspartokinase